MEALAWKELFSYWHKKISSRRRELTKLVAIDHPQFDIAIESGSDLFPGASEVEIRALENRLETTLPPSYRSFLQNSNGFLHLVGGKLLLPCSEVTWLAQTSDGKSLIEAWSDGGEEISEEAHLLYQNKDDCLHFRTGHLKETLLISSNADGDLFLLNPKVKTASGEWEAWDFGNKNPGAYRFSSFGRLMQREADRLDQSLEELFPEDLDPEDSDDQEASTSVNLGDSRLDPGYEVVKTMWGNIPEARSYLTLYGRVGTSLKKGTGKDEALKIVNEIYSKGAMFVAIIEVGERYLHTLIVGLPEEPSKKSALREHLLSLMRKFNPMMSRLDDSNPLIVPVFEFACEKPSKR